MTDEFISKQDAINIANDRLLDCFKVQKQDRSCGLIRRLEDSPSVDVVPVVHAYWILQKENHEFKEALMNCSACGYPVSRWTGNTNFCPNCGAIMDGEE